MSAITWLLRLLFGWLRSFVALLPELRHLWALLKQFFASLLRWLCQRRPKRGGGPCVDIPITEYRRPDPLLYSQSFLMSQGLSVTWDNPDIQLYDSGVPVNSYQLHPDHDYEVRVRVWNNSYDAPAANLPVNLSYLSFGVGTTPSFVGKTYIDLGVKGSSQCPAYASFNWHTPATEGHYCLQALLDWPDDANPDNNLGQENTNVGITQSPAKFEFTVKNTAAITRCYQLEPDQYELPEREPCPPGQEVERQPGMTRLQESRLRWDKALKTQRFGMFPVGSQWQVMIEPADFSLGANEQRNVIVQIDYLAGQFSGQQAFNVNAFASGPHQNHEMVGGVTLVVQGGA